MYKPDQITPQHQSIFINYPSLNGNYYIPPVYVISSQINNQHMFKQQYDQLKTKYESLLKENQQLKNQLQTLNNNKKTKRIIKRRREEDIQREIKCPYQNCNKEYASEVALNLHIKQKHNGGTKRQRERYAKKVLQAMKKHQQPPKDSINLPPGYLQEFKKTILDHIESDSSVLYSEESQ